MNYVHRVLHRGNFNVSVTVPDTDHKADEVPPFRITMEDSDGNIYTRLYISHLLYMEAVEDFLEMIEADGMTIVLSVKVEDVPDAV